MERYNFQTQLEHSLKKITYGIPYRIFHSACHSGPKCKTNTQKCEKSENAVIVLKPNSVRIIC